MRADRSRRFSVRVQNRRTSRASQSSRSSSPVGREHVGCGAVGAQHPGAEVGSLKRRSRMASSSSRHAASDSSSEPNDLHRDRRPTLSPRSTDDEPVLERAQLDSLGVDRVGPIRPLAASARLRTSSANAVGGAMASTSPHSTACWPLTPSTFVANTSARSRRTWRLSTTRVSPPVPGSTASSGTSGSETAEDRSSTRRISSHARASS